MSKPAPYAADTRAKGWRFELDHERIRQSDTWALASPDARPWLLMLWMVAWEQVPCGSLPAEDALIAARIGMSPKAFAKHRDVLLRGWWLADDGRLYHDTLCERVQEMVGYREKSAKRVAEYKARMREKQAGNALPQREQQVKNDTGTGTGTGTREEQRVEVSAGASPRRATRKCPTDFVVTEAMADWAKRECPSVPLTRETAAFRDHTFKTAISDWQGAWRNWVRRASQFAPAAAKTTARQTEVAKWLGPLAQQPKQGEIIDMEDGHGPRIAMG